MEQLSKLFGEVGKIELPITIQGELPDNVKVSINKSKLLLRNSGLPFAAETLGKAGRSIRDLLASPFSSKNGSGKKDSSTETAETPGPARPQDRFFN
jgi:hypothetical protein